MTNKSQKLDAKSIALIGVLGALTAGLGFTPLGFIPLGIFSVTTMQIPVIISGIVAGPRVGAIIGFIFGLSSMLHAVLQPTLASVAFYNPIVALVPRVLIGIVAYYAYVWAMKWTKNKSVPAIVGAVLGTLTNTVLVLALIFVFYQSIFGDSWQVALSAMGALFVFNGIPEIILAIIVVVPSVAVLKRVYKGPQV